MCQIELKTCKRFIDDFSHPSHGIDIVFENIKYTVQVKDFSSKQTNFFQTPTAKKQILKGVTGILKAGKVNAIMGTSGAGKTTLINILSCRIQFNPGGKITANNFVYNKDTFGNFANYVMQQDFLMETLTVRQTLDFAARLKLKASENERKIEVNRLARSMRLEKCMNTLVGGILIKGVSGGERKRISIALELISNSQVIFLDEPTTGLDSLTSYIICYELHKLAHKRNKTVVMTIHQQNSQIYSLFDELVLLVQGKIIYHSEAKYITNYFRKNFGLNCPEFSNPHDFFMSKIHHERPQNVQLYQSILIHTKCFKCKLSIYKYQTN